jgi:hypothetical protein
MNHMTEDLAPTAEAQQEASEQAFALDQSIKAGLLLGRQTLWQVAKDLYEFDDMSGWVKLGIEKAEWLADPEISMTSTTYYRLVGVWRELAVHRKVDPEELGELDISKVAVVLPQIQMGKVKLEDALDDAHALGARDLREKYMRRKEVAPAPDDEDVDDYEGYIEGHESEPVHPPEELWDELVAKAKGRRRNLVTYITQTTDWEKIGDGDGSSREDWALPAFVVDEEEDDEDEEEGAQGEGPVEGEDASADNGSARALIDRAKIHAQAQQAWNALRTELLGAAQSGQAHPRIDGRLIRPGVHAANLLIEQQREKTTDDEWTER